MSNNDKNQQANTPAFLSMSEYSTQSGISLSKVKRLKMSRRLPYFQEGKVVRIPAAALNYEWLTSWREERGLAS
jgi:hypothetical protein